MKAELEPAACAMIYAHAHATGTDAGNLNLPSRPMLRDLDEAR
jgi:hypothetical protein